MKLKYFFITLIVFINVACSHQPEFVLVTPSYNNERWCIKNIEAAVKQEYIRWRMIIIDDCSTDQTRKLLENFIIERGLLDRVTLISNQTRQGALKNIYNTVHACEDHEIIILYDGDDWFLHNKALSRIAQEYEDANTWMTYGSWQAYPNSNSKGNCRPLHPRWIKERAFREVSYVTSHPRTFYAWLFKKIAQEDLLYNGEFFQTTWDLAIMFPLLEMSSNNHIKYIPDLLYVYNMDNPINDYKCHAELQQFLDQYIRAKKKYKPL